MNKPLTVWVELSSIYIWTLHNFKSCAIGKGQKICL